MIQEIIYIGEFDCKHSNKEFTKLFLVSKIQPFRKSLLFDIYTVTIFLGSRLFLSAAKAYNFAVKFTNNIHYIHYVNQSYPIIKL